MKICQHLANFITVSKNKRKVQPGRMSGSQFKFKLLHFISNSEFFISDSDSHNGLGYSRPSSIISSQILTRTSNWQAGQNSSPAQQFSQQNRTEQGGLGGPDYNFTARWAAFQLLWSTELIRSAAFHRTVQSAHLN